MVQDLKSERIVLKTFQLREVDFYTIVTVILDYIHHKNITHLLYTVFFSVFK